MQRRKTRAPSSLVTACMLCALLAGCKAIIGIKDRDLDESLADAGPDGGDGRGSSGKGGSGGRGGSQSGGGKGGSSGKGGAGGTAGDDEDAGPMTPVDGGDAMTPPEDPCKTYCETVQENCKSPYKVWASVQQCEAVCAKIPLGDLTDKEPVGNTVACRLHNAILALDTGEPRDHCASAGPGGAGVCGDNCENYCALAETFCADDTADNCLSLCPGLRDLDDERGGANETAFDVDKHHDGDFLQCRLVHIANAALSPSGHCWHAKLAPKPHPDPQITDHNPCADLPETIPRCKDYCRLHTTVCTGDLAQYESEAQCIKLCESLDKGTNGDQGGQNTIGCRRNHSYNASVPGGGPTHCPHSGPGGHGVCGANCDSYCTAVASACSTAFNAKYANKDACLAECTAIPDNGKPYSVAAADDGNKFFCRLLHTARSFEDANNCAAALGGGDCN